MSERFARWRKSTRSQPEENCVEVGVSAFRTIGVRDTKAGGLGPVLEFGRSEWSVFLRRVRVRVR